MAGPESLRRYQVLTATFTTFIFADCFTADEDWVRFWVGGREVAIANAEAFEIAVEVAAMVTYSAEARADDARRKAPARLREDPK